VRLGSGRKEASEKNDKRFGPRPSEVIGHLRSRPLKLLRFICRVRLHDVRAQPTSGSIWIGCASCSCPRKPSRKSSIPLLLLVPAPTTRTSPRGNSRTFVRSGLCPTWELYCHFDYILSTSDACVGHDLHVFPSEFGASPTLVIFAALMKPLSRGWLPLSSSDPAVPPLIDSGYFTDPGDMPRTVHAMRVAEQLAKATLLSDIAVRQLFACLQTTDSPPELKLRCALKSVRIFSMWVLVAGGQPPRPLQR
jgi:hypothetical protein